MEVYFSGVISVVAPLLFFSFSLSFLMCDLKEHETNTGNRSKLRLEKKSAVHAH